MGEGEGDPPAHLSAQSSENGGYSSRSSVTYAVTRHPQRNQPSTKRRIPSFHLPVKRTTKTEISTMTATPMPRIASTM